MLCLLFQDGKTASDLSEKGLFWQSIYEKYQVTTGGILHLVGRGGGGGGGSWGGGEEGKKLVQC